MYVYRYYQVMEHLQSSLEAYDKLEESAGMSLIIASILAVGTLQPIHILSLQLTGYWNCIPRRKV